MSRLARSVPGYTAFGSLEPGTVATDIVLNRYQIGAGTVSQAHIAAGSITTEKIQVGGLSGTAIADGQITTEHIAVTSITGDRIAFHTITGDNIVAGTITADLITVTSLSALSANLGSVTAGNIWVGSGGIVVSSEAGGATPDTGIIIEDSVLTLRDGGTDIFELNGASGTFTIRTAASGVRTELVGTGVTIYDAADVARVTLLSAEGLGIRNDSIYEPGEVERISFKAPEWILYTDDIDSVAGWSESGCDVFVDQANDSDGDPTLDKLCANDATSWHYVYEALTGTADATTYRVEAELKAAERTKAALVVRSRDGTLRGVRVDLSAGEIHDYWNDLPPSVSASIEDMGSGVYKVVWVDTLDSGATAPRANIFALSDTYAASYAGGGHTPVVVTDPGIYAGRVRMTTYEAAETARIYGVNDCSAIGEVYGTVIEAFPLSGDAAMVMLKAGDAQMILTDEGDAIGGLASGPYLDVAVATMVVTGDVVAANLSSEAVDFKDELITTLACSGAMTIGMFTNYFAYYWFVGKFMFYHVGATFTLGGTAATDILFDLPDGYKFAYNYHCASAIYYDGSVTSPAYAICSDADTIIVRKSPVANWTLGAGCKLEVQGWFEWAAE